MKRRSRNFQLRPLPLLLLGVVSFAFVFGLKSCNTNIVQVDKDDPDSPQYAYRLDELALLQMAADDVQNLERKKQYSQIYDRFGSRGFKKNINRRLFLIMSNCVETHLGGLQEFNRTDIGFRREFLPDTPKIPLDVLNRRVQRAKGTIEEQMVFVGEGFNFKLNSLYWIAKDKHFLKCIDDSMALEAATQPRSDTIPQPAESDKVTESTLEEPAKEEAQSQKAHSDPDLDSPTSEQTDSPAIPGESKTEHQEPVQVLKPEEQQNMQPIQARPAGAGAVKDVRPEAPKPPTPQLPENNETPTPLETQDTPASDNSESPD